MRIIVQIKPRSAQAKVEKVDGGRYKVWVRAVPEKGKANDELIEILADHFGIAKSSVRIVIGQTAREKLVEISGVNE